MRRAPDVLNTDNASAGQSTQCGWHRLLRSAAAQPQSAPTTYPPGWPPPQIPEHAGDAWWARALEEEEARQEAATAAARIEQIGDDALLAARLDCKQHIDRARQTKTEAALSCVMARSPQPGGGLLSGVTPVSAHALENACTRVIARGGVVGDDEPLISHAQSRGIEGATRETWAKLYEAGVAIRQHGDATAPPQAEAMAVDASAQMRDAVTASQRSAAAEQTQRERDAKAERAQMREAKALSRRDTWAAQRKAKAAEVAARNAQKLAATPRTSSQEECAARTSSQEECAARLQLDSRSRFRRWVSCERHRKTT